MELPLILLAVAIVLAAWILSRRRGAGAGLAASGVEHEAMRTLLSRVDEQSGSLSRLVGAFEESRRREEEFAELARGVERLVAGSFGRGRSGENILASALAELPPEMVVRDFRIGGRVCEFAIRMSDGKLLPVDSKWGASAMLSKLEDPDPAEREKARRAIESDVGRRLEEVSGYVDPAITVPMAVVAVPDAVFACCRKVHALAKDLRVSIVSYGLALPFLLTVWMLHRSYARDIDATNLRDYLHQAGWSLKQAEDKLEAHLARGLTQATNAAAALRTLLASSRTSLEAIHREFSSSDEVEPPAVRIEAI